MMPLYEYACRTCGERFEVLQRIGADASGVPCPACGADDVAKQFSTFAAGGGLPSGLPASATRPSACGGGGFS